MNDEKQATSEIVVSEVVKTPKRRYPHLKAKYLIIAVVVVLVLCLLAFKFFVIDPKTRENQERAIKKADTAARGFKRETQGYSFTLLNTAVKDAYEKKCSDAYAVYDEANKHPNGMPTADMKAYKSRIDSLCSGK